MTDTEIRPADEAQVAETDDTATLELLTKAGLDHVPTAVEAKAILDARRDEIRTAVLLQADARDWCLDGTRQVCANLRLPRPGDRVEHLFETEVTLKVAIRVNAFTEEGAAARIKRQGLYSRTWFQNHLYGMTVSEAAMKPIVVNGEEINLFEGEGA